MTSTQVAFVRQPRLTKRVRLMMSPQQVELLDRACHELGVSRSEFVRDAIAEKIEADQKGGEK